MVESELCGYLRIEGTLFLLAGYTFSAALADPDAIVGLTPDHPTLTTFFEGEIIGSKYTFQTRHTTWGATDKTDMAHWARFPAWRPLANQAKKPDFHYKNSAQRENIFMRWKETFLVPDHRVREILGASFEGFYYICFNQVTGNISGIYFHARSEKYVKFLLLLIDYPCCHFIRSLHTFAYKNNISPAKTSFLLTGINSLSFITLTIKAVMVPSSSARCACTSVSVCAPNARKWPPCDSAPEPPRHDCNEPIEFSHVLLSPL